MSGIDADAAASGNQSFTFTGAAAFTSAGQIRFVQNGTDGCLQGDVTGDGVADLNIQSAGVTTINSGDLLLWRGDVSRPRGGAPFLKQNAPENGRTQRRPVEGRNDLRCHVTTVHDASLSRFVRARGLPTTGNVALFEVNFRLCIGSAGGDTMRGPALQVRAALSM